MERLQKRSDALTELTREIGPTETSIPVLSTASHSERGELDIQGEIIAYASKTPTSFEECTREFDLLTGAPATWHPGGAYVYQRNPDAVLARKGGVAISARPDINFADSVSVTFTVTDDAVNNRTNVSANATGVGVAGPTGPTGPIGPTGATGVAGPMGRAGITTTWYEYIYSNVTTNADPGAGFLRINNATHFSATEIYVDANDALGGIAIGLSEWAVNTNPIKGVVRIERKADANVYAEYWLTGQIAATGYYRFTVDPLDISPGTLADNDPVYLAFTRAGEMGPTGPAGGPTGPTGPAGSGGSGGDASLMDMLMLGGM